MPKGQQLSDIRRGRDITRRPGDSEDFRILVMNETIDRTAAIGDRSVRDGDHDRVRSMKQLSAINNRIDLGTGGSRNNGSKKSTNH